MEVLILAAGAVGIVATALVARWVVRRVWTRPAVMSRGSLARQNPEFDRVFGRRLRRR